ncbi:MAG: signal peptidase I [Polyangiales bacterium]
MSSLGSALRALLTLALWISAGIAALKFWYVDVLEVPHNAMAPTLVFGEQVLVWRHARVDMGDIVVCEHPTRPGVNVLGRAVAFAGHTISVDDMGSLTVDSDRANIEWEGSMHFYDVTRQKLFDMRVGSIDYRRQHRHQFVVEANTHFALTPYSVGRGVYLLGDNRSDGADSREFGEVDPGRCKGQVFMRLAPAQNQHDDVHHGYLGIIR